MTASIPAALIESLAESRHAVLLTGSGTSAESGIPTFRDAQTGLWAEYRPEDLATPEAFARNPRLVWDWYAWRRELVGQAEPNPGHVAIAELQTILPALTLITQNVDGLHQRAGSHNVIEFHGNIMRSRCLECHAAAEIPAHDERRPPHCPQCDALLRPDVVWFGESIPPDALRLALAALESCDVFMAIGTSAQVQPAAGLGLLAKQHGATLIEINPATTPLTDDCDFVLNGASGELLPAIINGLHNRHTHA